jgi:transcription-repair coupling factor (superfamily II helicase)
MIDFVDGRHDILCCTTIIESGLDIPRANTMIVNQADRFGLAQLYQLRGRIGRSRERAFCYLVVPADQRLNPEAAQRLAVLQRFTELGAGFQVATADLEIRGAGELLGAKQSGLVAAVGFDTYARILEEGGRRAARPAHSRRARSGNLGRRAGVPARRLHPRHWTAPGILPPLWPRPATKMTSSPSWPSWKIATAACPTRPSFCAR